MTVSLHVYIEHARRLLRPAPRGSRVLSTPPLHVLVALIVVFGAFYGAVMGTFGGVSGERLLQVAYSATKVPILLIVAFGMTVPSFFVLNTLFGLRDDFREAVSALLCAQAVLALVLASLAPYTALWYRSSTDYPNATLFNAAMFAVASFAAQGVLRRRYRPLVERNGRHRWMLRAWLLVYAFVGVQMAWLLRPFIGDPARPTQFFREQAFDNAYVIVARLIWQALME